MTQARIKELEDQLAEANAIIASMKKVNLDKPIDQLTPAERVDNFIGLCAPHEYMRPMNISQFVNGTMSVSPRSKQFKLPLQFLRSDLFDGDDLRNFNSFDRSKIMLVLVAIDLKHPPLPPSDPG